MDRKTKAFVLDILQRGKDLTLATVRDDGYPQATTVSYASDGLTIYVGTGRDSQKVGNIRHCPKVSLTIDLPYEDWNDIRSLSMAATAEVLEDPAQIRHAMKCLAKKFPAVTEMPEMSDPEQMAFLRITPSVISVLNYQLGFGHTDLVEL